MSERMIKTVLAIFLVGLVGWVAASRVFPELRGKQSDSHPTASDGPGPMILTEANFDSTLAGTDRPVLVDFWATWCPPCRKMTPDVDALAAEMGDRAIVAKVDVDQAQSLAQRHKISALPTVVVFKGGKEVARQVGYQTRQEMSRTLSEFLN